jgi:hypothetical protein
VYRFWIDDWTFRIAGRGHLFKLYFLAKQLDFDMATAESPNIFPSISKPTVKKKSAQDQHLRIHSLASLKHCPSDVALIQRSQSLIIDLTTFIRKGQPPMLRYSI